MAYIGKTPTVGNFVKLDTLTASATASYTMQVDSVNFSPESVNHMMVSLNGVIQSPTTSYTISGSTITFASALTSSDSIDFIMVYGNVLDIGTPSDATVTNAKTNFVSTSSAAGLQIKGDGTTDGTLQLNCSQNSHGIKLKSPPHSASASYTLTFPNDDGSDGQSLTTNGSGVLTWADSGGTNTPLFQAYLGSNLQNIATTTNTTVIFDQENLDPDGVYNTSDGKFTVPSGKAGKYYFYAQCRSRDWTATGGRVIIQKNGYNQAYGTMTLSDVGDGGYHTIPVSCILDLSVGDYVLVQFWHSQGGTKPLHGNTGSADWGLTYFTGFKLL